MIYSKIFFQSSASESDFNCSSGQRKVDYNYKIQITYSEKVKLIFLRRQRSLPKSCLTFSADAESRIKNYF